MTESDEEIKRLQHKIKVWHARAEHGWSTNNSGMAQDCLDNKWQCVVKLAKLQNQSFPENPEVALELFGPIDSSISPISTQSFVRERYVPDVADGTINDFSIFDSGERLSAEQAQDLEVILETNPQELVIRIKLLGYYVFTKNADAWFTHERWMLMSYPSFCISSHLPNLETINDQHIDLLTADWRKICSSSEDPKILGNAGDFLYGHDDAEAASYYLRAERLEPQNVNWTSNLLYSYIRLAKVSPDKYVQLALQQGEKALQKQDHPGERRGLQEELFRFALEHHQTQTALKHATALLEQSREHPYRGSFLEFRAQVYRGLAALQEGDIAKSEQFLMNAAECDTGSASDFKLARELLKLGKRETVEKFLQECRFHCVGSHRKQIIQWSRDISDGLTPDLCFEENEE